ncbi:2-phytyl-1,4-beta-naphthoquinone methyltransferase, chloroplastic [Methylobacterium adhaesivum]|jgi:predicted methyltransferase|uniref:Methyltransferase domain-containing protein n=1 Tax=Methylobacterium adhaesivum TaxID=333297 RepID=A0ABT8BLW8_9HYPH|nr:methyltransferase domain-containing protein [Methylobacterium adhaesivum]MDN3592813.1 methyltransferase domain-containing protein [Methylobacterium adhaesivum]GJD29450.1 2-phytyl-1,4-beta-naphthoquinone methyltransferase, chloroplastic [Methylobacterium adhaesivum]
MIRFLSLAAVLIASPALAQEPPGPPGAPASAFPDPDRPVAEIIAPLWASEAERDAIDEVGQVIRLMDIRPGQTVADIGAGSGYYTVRLAERVGPEGHVFAEDVTPLYLAGLERRVRKAKLAQVTVVRGEPHDPRLPAASLDAAVLVHMYHEIAQPFGLLHNLAAMMKPGGRVGIVDADTIPSRHGTPLPLLRCELAVMGYHEIGVTVLHGGSGYLAVFEAPAVAARPEPATVRSCPDTVTRAAPKGR